MKERSPWITGWAADLAGVAFGWVPFYLWLVLGLGLGQDAFGGPALTGRAAADATALAIVVALGITYVHRHYTFFVVYGDREVFAQRARAFWIAPLAALALVGLARWTDAWAQTRLGGIKVSPWQVVLLISGAWNIWHTLQQRYGLLRIYAGKVGGGLEAPAHARRDRALLWLAAAAVAVVLPIARPELLGGHTRARMLQRALDPITASGWAWALVGAALAGLAWALVRWLRCELKAPASPLQRVPRLALMGSSLLLLALFIVHGPVIGYLCFGTAHAIEYVVFVHQFGARKYGGGDGRGPAAALLRDAWRGLPLLAGGLLLVYYLLRDYQRADLYLVYYTATSLLHFLYDGWIWKVRRPELARTLGAGAAATRA